MNSLSKTLIVLFISFLIILPCRAQDYNVESSKYMVDGMEALMNNDYETAFDNFSKELKDNPKNVQALVLLACYYNNICEAYKKALSYSRKSVKIATKNKYDNYTKSAAYVARADSYRNLGKIDKAINDYSNAIDYCPEEVDFYMSRAVCYLEQKKYDLLENDCKKIISLDPTNISAYGHLGSISMVNYDYETAIEYFNKVIELDGKNSSAYKYRGDCYLRLSKYVLAIDDFIRSIEIDGNMESLECLLRMNLLRPDLLDAKLKVQCAKQPDNLSWPYILGIINEYVGLYPKAVEYYEKSYEIEQDPYILKDIERCKELLNK